MGTLSFVKTVQEASFSNKYACLGTRIKRVKSRQDWSVDLSRPQYIGVKRLIKASRENKQVCLLDMELQLSKPNVTQLNSTQLKSTDTH